MVGLNFTDEKEATKFNQAVEAKLQDREKRASEQTIYSNKYEIHFFPFFTLAIRRSKDESSAVPIGRPPVNTVDAGMDPFAGSAKKGKPKRPKGKLSKSDIGAPSDFRHLSHVGFDPSTGAFDVSY